MVKQIVYVGTYTVVLGHVPNGHGQGIELLQFDTETGQLAPLPVQEEGASHLKVGVNPAWLSVHPHKPVLYATLEIPQEHAVVAVFHVAPNGALKFASHTSAAGGHPCHLGVDPSGTYLAVANYGTGNVPIFTIREDGSLEAKQNFQHSGQSVNASRQEAPHAHQVVFDPKDPISVLACDLGIDKVIKYRLDARTNLFEEAHAAVIPAGAGPRHLAVHPSEPFVFVLNELHSSVTVLRRDAASGALDVLSTVPALPADYAGKHGAAEIAVSNDSKFVYVSNRGPDNIAIFKFSPSEAPYLTLVGHEPTYGKHPRHFTLSPDGRFLLVANQDTDSIVVFSINQDSGLLTKIHQYEVFTPTCIAFLPQH